MQTSKDNQVTRKEKVSGIVEGCCEVCSKRGLVQKTQCCDKWVCFGDKPTNPHKECFLNHERFTLCGFHHNEEHLGNWKDCEICRHAFSATEMYAWYGTNEHNVEKLENPPEYEPTICAGCDKVIALGTDGHMIDGDDYYCDPCANGIMAAD